MTCSSHTGTTLPLNPPCNVRAEMSPWTYKAHPTIHHRMYVITCSSPVGDKPLILMLLILWFLPYLLPHFHYSTDSSYAWQEDICHFAFPENLSHKIHHTEVSSRSWLNCWSCCSNPRCTDVRGNLIWVLGRETGQAQLMTLMADRYTSLPNTCKMGRLFSCLPCVLGNLL